jgi:MFS family permease
MMGAMNNESLRSRLRPLYIAAFFHGFILFYAIEKLFMRSIGFSDGQIALAAIFVAAAMLIFQTPSGIVADRWSRKGVLIVASLILMLCCLIGGLSQSLLPYYIMSALWGVFFAIYLGTYDSIIYDTLMEEEGHSKGFEHYYGRINLYTSLALASSSLLSSLISKVFEPRLTYFLTIPLVFISIIALLKFREPQLHRAEPQGSVLKHTTDTLRAVLQKGYVFWIVLAVVLFTAAQRILFELFQLWYLAFLLPTLFWGPATALLQTSIGLSGPIANKIKDNKQLLFGLLMLLAITSLVLTSRWSIVAVIIAQGFLLTGFYTFAILLNHRLHDVLPAKIRAGSASAVGTIGQVVVIPLTLLFGWVSDNFHVFKAAWIIIALVLLATISYITVERRPLLSRD